MKIWIVNQYALIPSQSGGTRHHDIAKELASRGHEVVVWASSRHYQTGQEAKQHKDHQPVIEKFSGLTWVWLKTSQYQGNGPKRGLNMLSFFVSFLRAAFSLRPQLAKPDILVGSSVHPFAPLATLLLGRLWKIPSVTEIRDLWPGSLVEAGVPKLHPAVIIFSLVERLLYRYSDGLISVLPDAHDVYRQGGMRPDRIFVVPNGTDLDILEPASRPERAPFKAAYLGTFGHHNHLRTLLEAAEILHPQHPQIEISLIGSGPERQQLEELIAIKRLTNVHLLSPIAKSEVSTTLQQFDVLIFHLMKNRIFRYGISPNKLFDYLSSGRPVLFACESANNPVAQAGAGLSVPPEDPQAMADALVSLSLLDPLERLEMGRQGQHYVRSHHTIEALSSKFEKALQICLQGGAG